MFATKLASSVLSVMLVASVVGPAATAAPAAATATQQQTFAGTHLSFGTTSTAVVDYAVGGETVMESVKVQSKNRVHNEGAIDVGTDLSTVAGFTGAGLSLDAKSDTSATVTTDSGAQIEAHDNPRGILVVRSGSESQYVSVNVSSSSQAQSEGDQRVVVTTEDGTQGTFIVVGDGDVTVNDRGNVTATLGSNSQLVFRSYVDGRDDEDKKQEELIADGTAVAEVYVMQQSEGSSEIAADIVQYSEDTSLEVTQRSESTVTMTAERSEHQGKVIITSVSEAVIDSADDVSVSVDGEAAARASSYSELRSAANNGDSSKFMVRQQSRAEAAADVLVAVNHFSERHITVEESGTSTGDGTEGSDDATPTTGNIGSNGRTVETTDGNGAGFGVGVSLVAFIGVALYASRRF